MSEQKPFLFSIKGEFVEKIFRGEKTVEYRRRKPSLQADDVLLIYETSPRCLVVGFAVAGEIIAGTPGEVWEKTADRGCVGLPFYQRYFDGRAGAVAIELRMAVRFKAPLALPAGQAAPQSWSRWRGDWPLPEVDSALAWWRRLTSDTAGARSTCQ